MEFLKKLFKNKEKKTVVNFIAMLLLGIVLIIMSNTVLKNNSEKEDKADINSLKNNAQTKQSNYNYEIENKLKSVLANVEGVGDVDVAVTLANDGEIVVAEDSAIDKSESNDSQKKENNIKEESKKVLLESDKPLILKEIQPEIKGVLVVAKGGGNTIVKNSIIKAVQALLNIDINKIEVLKMK